MGLKIDEKYDRGIVFGELLQYSDAPFQTGRNQMSLWNLASHPRQYKVDHQISNHFNVSAF